MSAGPLYTTENTVGFSGMSSSFVDFYGANKFTALANSGAQTVASGAGVLIAVIGLAGSLLSGQAGLAPPSNSGASIAIVDAISGATPIPTSGASSYGSNTAGILYQFSFGIASGAGTGGVSIAPPDLTAMNMGFRSGLVVVCSGGSAGGYGLSVIWSKSV